MVFDKHDLDGNNAITKDEFHEFIYSMGRYMDEQELEAAWTFIELNGDGKIVGLICSLTLTPQLPVATHSLFITNLSSLFYCYLYVCTCICIYTSFCYRHIL